MLFNAVAVADDIDNNIFEMGGGANKGSEKGG